jgi:hypothetical protein
MKSDMDANIYPPFSECLKKWNELIKKALPEQVYQRLTEKDNEKCPF